MDAKAPSDSLETNRSDRFYILSLLLLVLPLKAWLLHNTEVPARDCIGYMRYALHFEQKAWDEVLRSHDQHPGYPFCVWLVSLPLRALHGGIDPEIMCMAAQTVSALAASLLLLPMFYLGKELLGARAAFWGTLLFQFLPVSGHHLADGVSEPLFLLFVVAALWQGTSALKTVAIGSTSPGTSSAKAGGAWNFFWCGLFAGLAFLTRPEGAFVVAAVSMVMVTLQLLPRWRVGWKRFFGHAGCLAAPALAAAGVYLLATGELTRKRSPKFISGQYPVAQAAGPAAPNATAQTRPGHAPDDGLHAPGMGRPQQRQAKAGLFASIHAAFIPRADDYPTRLSRGAGTLIKEFMQGCHYLGILGVALGLFWFGRFLVRNPAFWVVAVYGLLQTATLIFLAIKCFYVSDRHVMVLILPASFLMAAGFLELGSRIQRWLGGAASRCADEEGPAAQVSTKPRWRTTLAAWPMPMMLLALMLLYCLPKTVQRVHGNRAGNHLAGVWLKATLQPGDIVVDDHSWSHFYAGQVFEEGKEPAVPAHHQPLCYVVMTRSRDRDVDRGRREEEERLRAASARLVYHWPEKADAAQARVVVYVLPRDRQTHPWKVASR